MIRQLLKVGRLTPVLVLFVCLSAFGQDRNVTGKVTSSEDGSTIPGVNVLVKGTTNGTVTDIDGNYSISVGSNATLVFSAIGFATQEITVGTQSTVDVVLSVDITTLSEIVVTGYGTQEKKEITGAAVAVTSKDFNRGNQNDPAMLMQGKVAGLSIYNKGGDPTNAPVMRLRGISTVGSNLQPLVVIDGVLGASLSNIDPNDIESVTVLKDGSAAAIYGSRGSSGVILVTTKRGSKSGGLTLNYNGYVSASSIFKKVPVMSPSEYVAAGGNDLGSQTDWQKEVTRTAISNVHNISITGGNGNTTYRMSANFRDVQGIMKKSGFDQINARSNITHSALDGKLKIDFNMSLTNRNSDLPFNQAFRYASLYNPTAPIRFSNGDYYQAILFDNYNPVALIEQNSNKGQTKTLNYGLKLDYNIFKNLTWTVNYGRQFDDNSRSTYYSSESLYLGYGPHGIAQRQIDNHNFTLFETYGTFSKSAGRLDISVAAGYSYQQEQFDGMYVELRGFPSDALGVDALQLAAGRVIGNADFANISSYRSPLNKIVAGFARINLTFDNGIFFNASVREEGSSKLGADHRYGLFPALGAGVDLNKYLQLPNVNLLKLRVGYGVTGSLPGLSGQSQDRWAYSFGQGGSVSKTLDGNKDLKWEQKAETNIGVEFGLGKLSGTLDLYDRTISDLILYRAVPTTTYPSGHRYENAGKLNTKGIELALNYSFQFGELTWNPGIVMSSYKSVLKEYIIDRTVIADFGSPGQNGTYPIKVEVGQPIGTIWGPVFDGVESNGAPRFKDLNGDGNVVSNPSDALATDADMKVLGYGIPKLELGFTNQITWRSWDMNAFFRGAFGHSLINQFRAFYEPIDPGAINSYNRITTDKAVAGLTSAQYSSLYVEKASFVKLDNMTIGYTVKTASDKFKGLRIYATGQNLFQITSYTGIDPEPALVDTEADVNDSNRVLAPGIDRRNNYYTSRTFTLGVNITF